MRTFLPFLLLLASSLQAIAALGFESRPDGDVDRSGLVVQIMLDQPDCDSLCVGQVSCMVQGGTGPYGYTWSTGSTDSFATGLCANQQVGVLVVDSNGTSMTAYYTMPPRLSFNVVTTPASCQTCCDGTGIIQVSSTCTLPVAYEWSPGFVTLPYFNNLCGNITYTVCVTDACGCSNCDTVACGYPTGLENPMPETIRLNVSFDGETQSIQTFAPGITRMAEIECFDMNGRSIYQASLAPNEVHRHPAGAMTKGIYLIVVRSEHRIIGQSRISIH